MYIGIGIFAVIAVVCVVIGIVAMKRDRDYGNSDGGDDDFDFDAYEGFDDKKCSGPIRGPAYATVVPYISSSGSEISSSRSPSGPLK